MRRIVLLIIIVCLLGAAAPAAAQVTATATPNRAGQASTLHFDLDGLAPPIGGRIPLALQLSAPQGFKLNPKAVAKRCSQESAKLNECPRASRFGRGVLVVHVTAPDQNRDVTIPLNVYLHSRKTILAVAYVFGWQVVPGTLSTQNGISVTFNPLPAGPPFPGVSYALKRITFDFGAKRMVKHRVKGKRHAKKRRVSLIRNPATCSGSWESSISLTFRDGSVTPLTAPTPCSGK